jgi:hypothetical protein
LPSRCASECLIERWAYRFQGGCVVIPIIKADTVAGIYGRRLDRSHADVWATGFSATMFEGTYSAREGSGALVATSLLDGLCILGTLELANNMNQSITVFAPGCARGFTKNDLKGMANRYEHVTVLGSYGSDVVTQLQRLGALVSVAAEEYEVARTVTSNSNPDAVLALWLEKATLLAKVKETTPDGEQSPVIVPRAPVIVTPIRDEAFLTFATRSWRIRGAKALANTEGDRLRVALSVNELASGRFHLDTLDLYVARHRSHFLDVAAHELHVDRESLNVEMSEVLNCAERARDESVGTETTPVEVSANERAVAQSWLEDPKLFEQLTLDLSTLGVVGESTNLMLCYLATISRKCERPLGVLVQSSSASGKSTLVDAVCSLIPAEDLVSLSALTSQALYYLGKSGLRHKVLSLAEEQGAQRASYALKLLLSEGVLTIASTGKDRASGRLVTTNYETSGPLALLMTTTATQVESELENRLVVLGVNEDRRQTDAIIDAQRRAASLEGFAARQRRADLRLLHANIQRLLQTFPVVIGEFTYDFPNSSTRHRRDHAKLLSMIAAITLLHQFQREQRSTIVGGETITYIEATTKDIERGLALAAVVFARQGDGLAPQSARLLEVMRQNTAARLHECECDLEDIVFTRRELREQLGWSIAQVRAATESLVDSEYVVVTGGGRGRCRTYRLVGELMDVGATPSPTFSTTSSGEKSQLVKLADVGTPDTREAPYSDSYGKIDRGVRS